MSFDSIGNKSPVFVVGSPKTNFAPITKAETDCVGTIYMYTYADTYAYAYTHLICMCDCDKPEKDVTVMAV